MENQVTSHPLTASFTTQQSPFPTVSGGVHLFLVLTSTVTIPQDTPCPCLFLSHHSPPSHDHKKFFRIAKEAPNMSFLGLKHFYWSPSLYPANATHPVNLHLHITSQQMDAGSLASIGVPKRCSLTPCGARSTISMTLYPLRGECVLSARLKTHPKPHWGRDRGWLRQCIPRK